MAAVRNSNSVMGFMIVWKALLTRKLVGRLAGLLISFLSPKALPRKDSFGSVETVFTPSIG